jgi:hypothetical protein
MQTGMSEEIFSNICASSLAMVFVPGFFTLAVGTSVP